MNFANARAIFLRKTCGAAKAKICTSFAKIAKKFCKWKPYLDNGWLNESNRTRVFICKTSHKFCNFQNSGTIKVYQRSEVFIDY